ncbi:MAG TPA: hypothetical protein VFW68_11000 [Rhodocyclaceae bacterium]|nr:hypothetical protein [Rhodocyclaceae bacterium]
MKRIPQSRWLALGALYMGMTHWPLPASAQDEAQPAPSGLFANATVDAETLDTWRGGAALNFYDLKSEGMVSNNQATNLSTGSNLITDGSFAGAAGFSTVVQNSGNNVLIQNATIINLQVQ